MLSDGLFLKCIDDTILLHSRFSSQPIYYYMYAHRGQQSVTDVLNGAAIDLGKFTSFYNLSNWLLL